MSPHYLKHAILCLAVLALFSGCKQREADSAAQAKHNPEAGAVAVAPAAPAASADSSNRANAQRRLMERSDAAQQPSSEASTPVTDIRNQLSSSAASGSFTEGERKFIRTANANFRVKDVYQTALAIEDAVAAQGGFVVRNDINSTVQRTQRRPIGNGKVSELAEYVVHGQLTVRVPSGKTQDFLRTIAGQIAFLDQRSFNAYDAQFDLLRQQLEQRRNQEAQEELGQLNKETGKIYQKADVINSRNEAKAARDNAKVAQKEFEDKIAFSTIQLSLYQLPNVRQTEMMDIDQVFEQSRPSFGSRLADALASGWDRSLDLVLQAVKLWPLWLLAAIGLAMFKRLRKSGRVQAALPE